MKIANILVPRLVLIKWFLSAYCGARTEDRFAMPKLLCVPPTHRFWVRRLTRCSELSKVKLSFSIVANKVSFPRIVAFIREDGANVPDDAVGLL